MRKELVIIGAGPGGYAAAFHAADQGIAVTLIDQDSGLGGVCLKRGCMPSKALLHIAKIINESRETKEMGVEFNAPKIDLDKIRAFKNNVITKLGNGVDQLAKQRKIEILQGRASFLTPNLLAVFKTDGGHEEIEFEKAILATGSLPMGLPFAPPSEKIWDSTAALDLPSIPEKLLIIGGGYIGMELAAVYQALGSLITVVEMTPTLLPGADRDLSMILQKRAKELFADIKLNTKVTAIEESGDVLCVTFENAKGETTTETFHNILIAIGRKNIFDELGLINADIALTEDKKFIKVNGQRQTTNPNVYAIGDISGQPMLAHKASAEAKVAVDAIKGGKTEFNPKAVPAVVFTDPEIAWCGLTETEAKEKNLDVIVSKFPWAASGRAVTLNRTDGVTKIIADAKTHQILGVATAGHGAGELISEGVLAIEKGLTAQDLANSIHPHPTLSETLMEAAEGIFGQSVNLPRKK
jgi:dihydrolipoamide dehydrogenase